MSVDLFANLAGGAAEAPREHAVENGIIRHLSVSQMKTANLCVRKWWWEKVQHKPGRTFPAQDVGIAAHGRLEAYLKTGVDALGDIERPGKKYLPLPITEGGPGLLIEHRFDGQPKGTPFSPDTALLRAGGVPLDGYIDVVNLRMLESGGRAFPGAEEVDPPGTIELLDHKTTSNIKQWGATEEQLRDVKFEHGIQMVGYGEWARLRFPGVWKFARLTHVDYQTGRSRSAKRISTVVSLDQIQIQWLTVNRLATAMVAAAKCEDQEEVPYNTNGCEVYRGCPYAGICSAARLSTVVPNNSRFAKEPMPNFLDDLLTTPGSTPAPTPSVPIATAPAAPAAPTYEQFLAWQKNQSGTAAPATAPTPVVAPAPVDPQAGWAAVTCADCGADLIPGQKRPPGFKMAHEGCPAKAAPAPVAAPAPIPGLVNDAVTDNTAAVQAAIAAVAPVEEKKTRAKKAKEEAAFFKTELTAPPAAPTEARVELFIDCAPGGATKRLEEYIAGLVQQIEKKYGAGDIRIAHAKNTDGTESMLSFGKWKGVLAYMVKNTPLTPGRYTVSSTGDFAPVVLETLVPLLRAEDIVKAAK